MTRKAASPSQGGDAAGYLAASATACVAFAMAAALYRIRTYDTFFHLAAGRLILQEGVVPASDPFSFTHRGAPWLNHSYGFQVLIAEIYELAGFAGLSLHQVLCAGALAVAGLVGLRRSPRLLVPAALLLALPFAAFREVLEARPHVLGFLGLAVTLQLVLRASQERDARVLLWIVPVYAAWAVAHGSHVLAFFVAGAGLFASVLASAARLRAGELAAREAVRQPAAWLAAVAALLVLRWLLAPAAFAQGGQHVASEFLESTISEWAPLRLGELLAFAPGYVYLGCMGLALAGALLAPRRGGGGAGPLVGPLAWLLLLAFCAASLSSRRMIVLLLFGAAPLWLPYAAFALERALSRVWERGSHALRVAAVTALWLGLFAVLARPGPFVLGAGLDEGRFPAAATQKLVAEGRVHRLYNAYNFGGYLMFAGVPVFVDGRAITVYPAEFLAAFERAYGDPRVFQALAARYRIDGVLLPAGSAKAAGLLAYLRSSRDFHVTHEDSIAVLFESAR
jgi:hypothetical protein